MKVKEEKSTLLMGGDAEVMDVTIGVSREAQMMVMNVLTSTLYTDPISAVWREYGCNAADANIEAGKAETPIEITLPTRMHAEAVIRDFGYGLTEARMRDVYCKLGESTKRDSNEVTGMIGIGAKAGYAYGEQFTVTTWNGGIKTVYTFFKDKGMPRMRKDYQKPSDAPDGTEVRVPVRAEHLYDFKTKAERVFRYFKVRPIVHGDQLEYVRGNPVFNGKGWRLMNDRKSVMVMGNVGYALDVDALGTLSEPIEKLLELGIELDFKIGDLEISASRERLQVKDDTKKAIIGKTKHAITELAEIFKSQIAEAKTLWAAKAAYADAFEKIGNVDKQNLSSIIDNKVTWQGRPLDSGRFMLEPDEKDHETNICSYQKKGYGRNPDSLRREERVCYVYPSSGLALVVNDLEGKNPQSRVRRFFHTDPAAYRFVLMTFGSAKAKQEYWKLREMEGVPIVLLSSFEPLSLATGASATGPSAHRAKHSAKAFELDEAMTGSIRYSNSVRSSWWKPVTVDLNEDGGVYVEIEKFRVVRDDIRNGLDSEESDDFANEIRKLRAKGFIKGAVYAFKRKGGKIKPLGGDWKPLRADLLRQAQELIEKFGQNIADHLAAKNHDPLLPKTIAPLLPDCLARTYMDTWRKMLGDQVLVRQVLEALDGTEFGWWLRQNDLTLPEPSHDLGVMSDEIREAYPMLGYSYRADGCKKSLTIISDYVKMVEDSNSI